MAVNPWWRGAVIYQVYPRSLKDSNGDGIGDIAGIIEKLDYIKSLHVDAIWVSPFFKSPMKDFGYDISDYRDIDPIFGDLSDFDRLIHEAHQRDLKVVIDQVLSHTSDQHAWFLESRESRDNPKADWYVWADPKEDGTPPNNWLSIFGGSAWEWEPRREQYYLHNFLKTQPDLNYHCDAVSQQILQEVEFWLKRGVDGFRLDAINMCFHDKELRNNPSKPAELRKGRGFSTDNPYAYQAHIYDNTRPETLGFMEQIRRLMDRYPGAVTLGEISAEDSHKAMADYTAGNKRLHMAYSFELLAEKLSGSYIRNTVELLEEKLGDGWSCVAIGNHDVVRVMSRWGGSEQSPQLAKTLNAMLFSLRGSVCSYQGEELGLTEAVIEQHQLQDPYGITFWPRFKGRDGCRTPMPWNAQDTFAGFSEAEPWLPVAPEHKKSSVDNQEKDSESILNSYRRFLAWRSTQSALRTGDIEFLSDGVDHLVFARKDENQHILCAFNFSNKPVTLTLPRSVKVAELKGHGFETIEGEFSQLVLPVYASVFGQIL